MTKKNGVMAKSSLRCEGCGKVITSGKSGNKIYCNRACKQLAYRMRKKGIVTVPDTVTIQ